VAFALGAQPIEDLRIETDADRDLALAAAQPYEIRELLFGQPRINSCLEGGGGFNPRIKPTGSTWASAPVRSCHGLTRGLPQAGYHAIIEVIFYCKCSIILLR
jgi:hypothetical protein